MYVCLYLCLYVCMYVCMYVCIPLSLVRSLSLGWQVCEELLVSAHESGEEHVWWVDLQARALLFTIYIIMYHYNI